MTLPTGVVTFLFTDVAGSTALWEESPAAMGPAMARHDALIEAAVTAAYGTVVRPRGEGDSRFAVFARASDALSAALNIQVALSGEPWSTPRPIRVRISVHTGETELREGDYYGSTVNRCARLRGIAHPGQILATQATVDVAGQHLPAAARLVDLGRHRLRDVATPEHVYQLENPGIQATFPPLLSLDTVANNLPSQLTPFIGREDDVAETARLLSRGRLVSLCGIGGTGKTRLAIAVGSDLLRRYRDGVWLVELAALTDPELVSQRIAQTLDLQEVRGEGISQTISKYLQGKTVLLVIDNCEHLIDACAKAIEDLLRASSTTSILATSQEPLGLSGEAVFSLQSLSAADALALFELSAKALDGSFEISDSNRSAITAICARLDGIPLAVELAAARTRALSPAQILQRLDDRFRLLTTGNRNAPERHRTLAAAVDWSHDLLTPTEQVLYRRLGVFRGGATLETITTVCHGGAGIEELDPYDLLDVVQRLVERNLIRLDTSTEPPRYRMLETIRDHAQAKLDASGESPAIRAAHLDWIRALAQAGDDGIRGNDAGKWALVLRAEGDNTRAALAWSLAGGDSMLGLETSTLLRLYWLGDGLAREGLDWTRALLDHIPVDASSHRARALACLGILLTLTGGDPIPSFTDALEMARNLRDPAVEGFVESLYGISALDRVGAAAALSHWEAARRLLPPHDPYLVIVTLNIANMYAELERYDDALPLLAGSLEAARSTSNEYYIAFHSGQYGGLLALTGELVEARRHTAAAVELARRMGDSYLLWCVLWAHAWVLYECGDQGHAAEVLREAASLSAISDPAGHVDILVLAARLACWFDDPERAVHLWRAAATTIARNQMVMKPSTHREIDAVVQEVTASLGDRFDHVARQADSLEPDQVLADILPLLEAWSQQT